jgi:hypothetical protein
LKKTFNRFVANFLQFLNQSSDSYLLREMSHWQQQSRHQRPNKGKRPQLDRKGQGCGGKSKQITGYPSIGIQKQNRRIVEID